MLDGRTGVVLASWGAGPRTKSLPGPPRRFERLSRHGRMGRGALRWKGPGSPSRRGRPTKGAGANRAALYQGRPVTLCGDRVSSHREGDSKPDGSVGFMPMMSKFPPHGRRSPPTCWRRRIRKASVPARLKRIEALEGMKARPAGSAGISRWRTTARASRAIRAGGRRLLVSAGEHHLCRRQIQLSANSSDRFLRSSRHGVISYD
jgi:hypothetical protein